MSSITTKYALFLLQVALLIFLGACASQRPPDGGPPDIEAPFIVETIPANGTVKFTGQEVVLEFSEHVQRQSFQESVHISPLLEKTPTYEWSGRTVTIVFPEPLLEDRTYVITVGTKVRDLRGGNMMKETMHLAFSTGDSLDNGSFTGTVFGDPPSGVSLFAYALPPGRADTLNPAKDRPEYAVQSSDDGAFHFYNVAPGSYRIFAVRDKSNDMRYNAEVEEIGIPGHDVIVEDSLSPSPPLRFYMHAEDTTRPSIQRIEAINERTVRIKFNETVYPQPLPLRHIQISDSATGHSLLVVSAVSPAAERFAWDFQLGDRLREEPYLVIIDSLEDGAGNFISMNNVAEVFPGSVLPDTGRPAIVGTVPTDRAKNIEPDSSFQYSFNRPLIIGNAFELRDSTDVPVALTTVRVSATEIVLLHPPLMPEAAYTICADLRELRDSLNERSVGDSVECIRFTTGAADQSGTLSGSIRTDDSSGAVTVRARLLSRQPKIQTTRADTSRAFRLDGLREGQYLLDAYIDSNANNRYDFGKAFPWTKPEPYGAIRDTLRVRARWETNGIVIPVKTSSE
ncbi:MAG: Ig-like domain-containing protein [Bacteroidetes bacterium]|nr:Ig-like domain-containing protein [Bacteroidota bacterium]